MMRTFLSFLLLATAAAFTPSATHSLTRSSPRTSIIMKEGLGIDPERKKLTRENEPGKGCSLMYPFSHSIACVQSIPSNNIALLIFICADDYFVTNTDKMTDQEKIPIAIAGLVGISLPFILGLIALYSAK
jgi:hypothetical protein